MGGKAVSAGRGLGKVLLAEISASVGSVQALARQNLDFGDFYTVTLYTFHHGRNYLLAGHSLMKRQWKRY